MQKISEAVAKQRFGRQQNTHTLQYSLEACFSFWSKLLLEYLCVVIPVILDARLVDALAGVTQEEGHTEFLHLPSAVLTLISIARRIQPSLSLVDREVELCVPPN